MAGRGDEPPMEPRAATWTATTDRARPRRGRHALLVGAVAGAVLGGALLSACGGGGSDSDGASVTLSAMGAKGKAVASDEGCTSCHTSDGSRSSGPSWKGVAGSEVTLDDGSTVTADDTYLRTAILDARSQVVKGFPNIMPSYEGQLTDAQVDQLIAYLRDLSPAASPSATTTTSTAATTTTTAAGN